MAETYEADIQMVEAVEEQDDSNAKMNIINLISTLNGVFLVENFVGINRFRFSYKEGIFLPLNCFNKIYAFGLIILYVSFYFTFLNLPTVIRGTSSLVDVLDEIPCIISLIQYVITLITSNMFYNNVNQVMFVKLADLDNRLITAATDGFYEKARCKANKFLLLLAISHAVVSITDLLTADEIDVGLIIFVLLYLIQKLEIIVFCLVIEMLKSRLDVINGYLKKFLSEKSGDRVVIFTVTDSDEDTLNMIGCPCSNNAKIRDLAGMYDTIGSICFMINDVFNFQIFMTLLSTFTYIVISIWSSLYYFRAPDNKAGPLLTIVFWCLATLLAVAMLCFVCEKLLTARDSTKVLVNQIIMDYNLPKAMRLQAKAFMELIEAWPLQVLIYDMFTVDITLMLKFVSVSTTYLIVIIQISHFM